MTLKRWHHLSGIIIASYIGLHLFNHMTAVWGAETHIKVMYFLRYIYRNPVVQPILIVCIISQIIPIQL